MDSITFSLTAEKTVVNDTILLIVNIAATILPERSEAEVKTEIRTILDEFVKSTGWQLSGLSRSRDKTGFENLSVMARTRVSETEYYNLDERAEKASRPGFKIISVSVNLAPPSWMIEKVQQELEMTLLTKATTRLKEINDLLKSDYRLGRVKFIDSANDPTSSANTKYYASASASAASASDIFGNAQKIAIMAKVSLVRESTTRKA